MESWTKHESVLIIIVCIVFAKANTNVHKIHRSKNTVYHYRKYQMNESAFCMLVVYSKAKFVLCFISND